MTAFILFVLACIGFSGIYIAWQYYPRYKTRKLRKRYQEALQGTNKKLALESGKEFYKFIRDGSITIFDEIIIAEDVASMNKKMSRSDEMIKQAG